MFQITPLADISSMFRFLTKHTHADCTCNQVINRLLVLSVDDDDDDDDAVN
jgi:hypothetical protein